MNKHVATLTASLVLAGGLTLAAPATATAGDAHDTARRAGCVTQGEFAKAKKNMTKKRVHAIFGTKGTRSAISSGGGFTFEIRSYKTCTPYGAVSVGFENGRLSSKSAVF